MLYVCLQRTDIRAKKSHLKHILSHAREAESASEPPYKTLDPRNSSKTRQNDKILAGLNNQMDNFRSSFWRQRNRRPFWLNSPPTRFQLVNLTSQTLVKMLTGG